MIRRPFPPPSLVVPAVLLLASGCAGAARQTKEKLVDRNGIDLIGSPADRTQVVIKDPGSLERYCKGPGPDVASTAESGISLGLSGAAALPGGGKIGEDSGRGALSLGGRNPAVLLARELLYRACELNLNYNLNAATALSVYKMTMDAIERIAAVQTGAGGAAAASAAPPKAVAGLPDDMNLTDQPASNPTQAAPAKDAAAP